MKIRHIIAIAACKILIKIGKLMGKGGSSTPGMIALKISPDVLRYTASQLGKNIIAVCGTNGKTTTNNLLSKLIESKGKSVVCNSMGANMLPGVACAFLDKTTIFGKLNAEYAAIECDEASLRHIVKHLTPSKVVITNLFRDQLDRYGAIESTIALINEALVKIPDATLILNGDDPLCVQFGKDRKCVFYGIPEKHSDAKDENEVKFCPICGYELKYNFRHYSQLGDFYCEKCGFKHPETNFAATNINLKQSMNFDVAYKESTLPLKLNYRGFYNIYNILASFCAFESLSLGIENINEVFNDYKPQNGRMESFTVSGKKIILNLAKNPAGFNQAISTVVDDEDKKDVFIAVNDMAQDGKDISWIWDVNFEALLKGSETIYASGDRKYDLALRLSYAGFDNVKILENCKEDIQKVISGKENKIYFLVNFTALNKTQAALREIADKEAE